MKKRVSGKKYAADKEEEMREEQYLDNNPRRKPTDVAQNLARGSKKKKLLKVIPAKKKGVR